MLTLIAILLLSYLIGSIPTAIIVGKITKNIDIRQYGSGNAGGTNAFRVLGWKAGLFVSLFDVAKGVFATAFISQIRLDTPPLDSAWLMILAGVCAILGHTYTIFAGFKGGKGVATGAGMIVALYPIAFLICLLIFALVLFSTGLVSVSSISAALGLPIVLWILNHFRSFSIEPALLIFSIFIPIFIIFTHRSNIRRLLKGEEKPFEKLILLRRRK
ncbi:MAG: glycerol-3-phosphate 1-O-acyltransferase PlsY [Candidatus Marinimicrobia bacterium]|jgi:glycerol-3-phosphate acyltransferase PlsY|nr:glycerol-3-phosphate 1-O-acyltransferase PlsY [Candidatus Neomarinimicrobiota bacterium]MCK9483542.1 glycerol-3-phosphate 1-O-acyltransferase PlsY [Candidatus Neomarinimicrobiota bacterium]MCK9559876.1 glycerol-3-phosphate 1-O-acyltransferase PlsY [Candidatus Neomarinimicrobiota bacterium]MDD5231143.1 glycerol-3-phosphate 1-O-acyltransferase PlsY [Candidatus Neomarinimicrobiota bacterium]